MTSDQILSINNSNKRYLVLLDKNQVDEGVKAICHYAQIDETMRIARSLEGEEGPLAQEQADQSDIIILDQLGVALVNHPVEIEQGQSLLAASDEQGVPILSVIEEEIWYAFEEPEPPISSPENLTVSAQYLKGYRDGVNHLIDQLLATETQEAATAAIFNQTSATWGLQATKVLESPYSGQGIRVAVLDTGMDLNHPDFVGRSIVGRSFVRGQSVQDDNGHGTHCIGTACGPRNPAMMPRYGIAYQSEIYAGKVLSNQGNGSSFGIIQGIDWAIAQNCAVISMSLGGGVSQGQRFQPFYENVGKRALEAGSLIIAAAGNDSKRPNIIIPVSSPANCPSFMAVAALDSRLRVATFSNAGMNPDGGEVDIAGPGVDIYSSAPHNPAATPQPPSFRRWSDRYDTISGTSMATPHVAGIAALYAQATGSRGEALWNLLIRNARRLFLPSRDVGSGLVQAPRR